MDLGIFADCLFEWPWSKATLADAIAGLKYTAVSLSERPWCKATLADATAGLKYTYDDLHSLILDCRRRRSTRRALPEM